MENKQLKVLWAESHRRGLNEASLRDLVQRETGKRSLRSLTANEADHIINLLWQIPKEAYHQRKGAVSRQQELFIRCLAGQVGWDIPQVEGLANKMYRVHQFDRINKKQASGLIEALKAIKKRKAA